MCEAVDPAGERCQEGEVDRFWETGPGSGPFLRRRTTAPATTKDAGEDVTKPASARVSLATRAFEHVVEIEAAEIEGNSLACSSRLRTRKSAEAAGSRRAAARVGLGSCWINVVRIEAELVVNLTLLGIAQNVVGFGEGLKFLLGSFVSWIYVRMIFARKFAERLADVVRRGRLLHSEEFVIIFFGGGCHTLLAISTACFLRDQKHRRKCRCQ